MTGRTESERPQGDTCAKIGVLTISDRAFRGEYEDRGGPAIHAYLDEHLERFVTESRVVPDEQGDIESAIRTLSETCGLVLTTGGTGIAARDVTPEATEAVCHKMLPGFGEVMRATSYQIVRTAILSRQTAGLCGQALVVNLPGNPKAIAECLDPVLQAIPPAVRYAGGNQTIVIKPQYLKKGRPCGSCGDACKQ